MTKTEWAAQAERLVAWWPHYDWRQAASAGSLDLWFRDVEDLDAGQVSTACEALYREGREWPPNGAQIRGKVIELASDLPPFVEVWERLHRAASLFGRDRTGDALEWLADWHPLAADLARMLPFREFCVTEEPEVVHGQARRSWEALCRRHGRDATLVGLPEAGLRAVERANDGPRPIGDVLRGALPAGDGAA